MAENTFEIILQATDNATASIRNVKGELTGVETATKQLSSTTNEATASIQSRFKEAGATLKDFRRTMFAATIAVAAITTAVREASKYNEEAKTTFDAFSATTSSLAATFGQVLSPALQVAIGLLDIVNETVMRASSGWVGIITMISSLKANIGESGFIEGFKQSLNEAAIAQDGFLNKLETTRSRVYAGETLEKIKKDTIDLGRISVQSGAMIQTTWDGVIDATNSLGSSLSEASELGTGFAKAAASIALAMAVVNTAQGVTRAFADYPWPFSMVVAGIVAAAGAIQIATISAQKFASGGRPPIGVPSIVGERGMELFVPDTAGTIIPNNQLGNMGGRSFSVNNYIYNPVVRSDEDIDKLTEEISMRLAREAERL